MFRIFNPSSAFEATDSLNQPLPPLSSMIQALLFALTSVEDWPEDKTWGSATADLAKDGFHLLFADTFFRSAAEACTISDQKRKVAFRARAPEEPDPALCKSVQSDDSK